MNDRQELTQERVAALFQYRPETGALIWKARPRSDFLTDIAFKTWNARFPGEVAGCVGPNGYRVIAIDDRLYYAHRIVWLLLKGFLPIEIDHDDGDRDNNREKNLVAATSLDNKKNRRLPRNNTSGVIGVTWCKQTLKWRAQMTVDRKMVHIGRFDAFEDAVAARKAKERELAFHINHGSDERPRYV